MGGTTSRPATADGRSIAPKTSTILKRIRHPSTIFKSSSNQQLNVNTTNNNNNDNEDENEEDSTTARERKAKAKRDAELARQRRLRVKRMFKRRDPALEHAISWLEKKSTKEKKEIRSLAKAVLRTGANGRIMREATYDDMVREALGELRIDLYKDESELGEGKKLEWSEERRGWEYKKFAGMMYYAFKVVDGRIMDYTETIPDYVLRTPGGAKGPAIYVSTYTPDGRENNSKIQCYIPYLWGCGTWMKIAPLLWLVEPAIRYETKKTKPGTMTERLELDQITIDATAKPKIILIEIPGDVCLIYRFFPFANRDYEEFVRGLKYKPAEYSGLLRPGLTGLKRNDITDANWLANRLELTDEQILEVQQTMGEVSPRCESSVREACTTIYNGSLPGEVRYAHALMETGADFLFWEREKWWMKIDRMVEREPVFWSSFGFKKAQTFWDLKDDPFDFLLSEEVLAAREAAGPPVADVLQLKSSVVPKEKMFVISDLLVDLWPTREKYIRYMQRAGRPLDW